MFTERLLNLINEKKISKAKFLNDVGLNKSSFLNWSQRGTIPNGEVLSKIADYFGVTTDYLLGNTDKKEKLSAESEELSEYLEKLRTDENYRMMFSLMNGATKEDVEKAVRVVKSLLGEE